MSTHHQIEVLYLYPLITKLHVLVHYPNTFQSALLHVLVTQLEIFT